MGLAQSQGLAVSVVGISLHRRFRPPRWLLVLPVTSAILIVASPLGFAGVTGTGGGGMLILSALALFVWLVVMAAYVAVRAPSSVPRP